MNQLDKLSDALNDFDGKAIVAVLTPEKETLLTTTPMTNREACWLISSSIVDIANHDENGKHFDDFLADISTIARLLFKHRRKFKEVS